MMRAILGASVAMGLLAGCGGGDRPAGPADLASARVTTLSINSFLWRAALETIGFMPITQADSNGGVILTDWYVNPKVANERVKVSVFVLDGALRADALRVNTLRQELRAGQWVDVAVAASTVQKVEDAILTRARQLRQGAQPLAAAND